MTNNEIKTTLKDVQHLIGSMDKSHIKNLLKILLDAQTKKSCAFFLFADIKRLTKKLLNDLIKSDHVNNYLNRKDMKKIYTILGDYHNYPICALCGQPIKIDSEVQKHATQSNRLLFSWDHIKPKSLGGSYDLANMQPTHKICNNKRGTTPIRKQRKKYKNDLTIDIEISFDLNQLQNQQNPRYRPAHFGLRKQDAWCHSQYCQHAR